MANAGLFNRREERNIMREELLKDADQFNLDPDSDWDPLNNDLNDALPNLDRWDDAVRKLLPDEHHSGELDTVADFLEKPQPVREEPKKIPQPIREVRETPVNRTVMASDKQLLFFILKYKNAGKICAEAGLSLKMLQQKVAYLSYKLKRYIDVAGLYRDTSPVKLEEDGILISRGHLVETPYKDGERFKIDFKDKYIILTRL